MALADKIEIINVSDVGKIRPHNEDSTLTHLNKGVALLADGMGGYKAGEVASAIAVTATHHEILQNIHRIKTSQVEPKSGMTAVSKVLQQALTSANSNIYNIGQQDAECRGMGTTIVSCIFHDDMVTVAHVGDSRLYRKRGRNFGQITKDHSLIQEVIDRGLYTPEEAMEKTPRNLVTRALGIEASVDIDVMEEQVSIDDIYLLCSDGLNDMVDDEEIDLILSKYSVNLVQAANELVKKANEKGGKDNISIILIRILGEFSSSGGFFRQLIHRFFEVWGK